MNEEIKYETKKVVKADYQAFYDEAVAKLNGLEETARAKVEEMIKDDKARLENIIEMCMEEIQVPVEEPETTEEPQNEEVVGE